jgi:prepilin-type N-terminal cleavage/methylation domain-containing protein
MTAHIPNLGRWRLKCCFLDLVTALKPPPRRASVGGFTKKRVRQSWQNKSNRGFTLLEILVVLVICAFAAAAICLGVTQAISDSKGRECAANLATIEGAKDEFSRDNPGVALTTLDQLKPYLRYGIPTCPAGGTYANILNSNQPCACSLGNTGKPGFHSLAQP